MQETNMVLMLLKKNHCHILSIFHHGDLTINVTESLYMKSFAPPPLVAMFLNHDIIVTHCLTKFHEDRTINVASRVLKKPIKKNAPPSCAYVFEPTGTIFQLVQDIIGTNHLTKFHDDEQ
ncbi:hypothetical protein DPMN_162164 [Dreissena polymorpha]|uniref:Uncharacterized protein n=1 Tax=Dreissena polymorpha TaxID=45954 RepID=A0A9D4EPV4_DREPO|nr:hypothetical protein DPMN_162164 [Dreissena polymorpha]